MLFMEIHFMFLILEKIYQGSHTTIQNKVRGTLFPWTAEKTLS